MAVWIYEAGLTDAEQTRARAAANAVFEKAGVTAEQAREAGLAALDEREYDQAHLEAWYEAERAAMEAACAGWSRWPASGYMDLA